MKFKDVRTIDSILLEYGLKPGAPTPVGNQQSGAVAKTTPQKSTTPPKKDLGSPTVTQGLDIPEPKAPEPQSFRAMDLGDGDEFKDKTGKVVGKVVSKVGDGPQPDKLVVDDGKGEYSFIDPEDEVFIDAPVTEKTEKSGKYRKKNHRKALNKVKPRVRQEKNKVKRLARLNLHESKQSLFEINFRNKEVINSSLDAQIRCGWEAESLWEDLEEQSDDVDNMTLDQIDNEFGGVDWDSMGEGFTDWIYENKQQEYMDDAINEFVNDREDDEDFLNDFIEHEGIEESDWDHVREDALRREYGDERFEEEGAQELSELYGYEDENWAREYVDEYRRGDFRSYLEELAGDDEDVRQAAYEEASENYDYDDWINDQWYSMSSFCEDFGIEISSHGSISEVADRLETFISEQSAFHDHAPEHGQYGDTSGSTTEYAVETDSSIDGYGTGAEIISPVFSTPRRMLAEMEKFFKWFQSEGVATNNSTGLHITMSYNPQEGETVNHEEGSSLVTANKVKMAVLLGDQYLLSEWGRGSNSYAKSQLADLKKAIQKLKVEGNGTEGIKNAEKFLADNISNEKFRSIHFKRQTDSKTNTKLIEFRIGGGEDYHMEFKRVFSSVVRYATTMIAGHTDQYQGDYVKALSRLLNKMNEVSTRDKEEVENLKSSAEDYAGHPILDSHKAIASAKNYLDFVSKMLDSMKTLNNAKRYLEPDADKKWKARWTEYLENTSDDLEDFDSSLRKSLNAITENINEAPKTESNTIRGYARPEMRPPSKTAVNVKNKGIRLFAEAMGMLALDIHKGKARSQPNAKSIGALRNFLRINDISESDVDANMKMAMEDLNFDSDLSPKAKIDIIRKGVAILFKKDIIEKPDYITAPQVEALVKGLWNVFNAEGFNSKIAKDIKDLCVKLRLGDASLNVEQKEIEVDISRMIDNAIDKREFNDFYNHLTRSSYSNTTYLVAPGHIYNKKSFNELIKFVKQSKPYTEPVSRSHNPNIYNDDTYEENALSKYTLLLRRRFAFLEDQHDSDVSLARQSLKRILTLTTDFFEDNKIFKDNPWEEIIGIPEEDIRNPEPDNPRVKKMSEQDKETYLELYGEADSQNFLGVMIYRLERLESTQEDINSGETERRAVSIMSEFVTDSIRECLGAYYKNKDRYPQYYVIPEVKSLIKQRFESLATFMRGIDKVFVDNGFDSQDTSIKRKQQLDTDAEAFRKKTANRPLATVNIPAHSWTYMKPELHEEFMVLMREQTYENPPKPSRDLIKKMVDSANNVGEYAGSFSEHIGIIVIPAAHWTQVNDALNGMDLIKLQQKVGNNSQTWRLKNYHKILDEFKRIYRHPQPKYIFEEWPQLADAGRDFISKTFNIEFTGKLDGRAGMGDVDELLPTEEAKNQVSGEPLEKNSAISWSISDANEKKQFAAYDWNKYHGKDADALKKATADIMKDENNGFYKAIQQAIESKNPSIKINADLINVGGVQDYTGDSSNTIGAKTNWINLANYFKIEKGVNNQGIELLKKTYQMFDSSVSGEFAAEGYSIDRWLDGVKKAKQYIEKNYKESGGNYFRKDADGNLGDAVSGVYGNASGPTVNDLQTQSEKPDYDKARADHPGFNTMMQNGMQNYLVRGEVNDLVGFLNNPDNDNVLKQAVLKNLINRFETNPGYPQDSFQDALAVTRRHGYESVFAKFDALPLQEQIRIMEQSEILNEIDWSKVKKGVAGAALAGTLATAPMDAKADTVSADPQLDQPVATQQVDSPDNTPKGKVLHGKFTAGMSVEDVQKIAPGGKVKDEYKEFRGVQGGTVKYKVKGAPNESSKAHTYFGFDDNNKLSSVHFVYQVHNNKAGPFSDAAKGEGLFGRKWGELGFWFKKAYNLIPNEIKSTPSGKASTSRGGEFGLGFGGVTGSGKGFAIGLDKTGTAMVRLPTADGQVTMSMRTQKGVVNNFHIMGMTITKVADNYDSPFDISESVPDLNRIRIINKLLADHFPAGDLKKQMLAYEAIPVPQMLTDFRGLIAQAGPDACARGIVRHYVNALGDEEKQQINLNEWSKQHIRTLLKEAPMQLVQDFKNLVIKVAELERDVQSKCTNPKLAKQCSYASKELDDYKQKMSTVQNQIMQFTSTEKDVDAAIDLGREQTTSEIRNYQSTVDKLLNKLSNKISGGFNYITFSDNGIEQATQDENGKTLNAKNKKKQESEVKSVEQIKQALIGYFKDPELFTDKPEFTRAEILEFLTAAANGEILSMEDIMTIGTDPNLPEMISFPEVVQTAAERHGNQRYIEIYNRLVDDGLMYQTVANTTSGNVGPGELALLLLAAPAEKGARGDLSVAGKEVEIKSGSYSVGDSKTTAGGKFNSDFIVKGNLAGGTLNNLLGKFFKEKLNKDFKKEFKAFMAKQERPNAIRFYKLEPSRMNLPAISDGSFEYVYNPFFKEQGISRDQYRSLARIFSQTTFSSEARQKNGHFYQVVTSLSELHNTTGWYAKQIEEIASTKGIDGPLLKRLIIALQFQSYYINKGHDQILYINKTNQKLTNVTNAKDLIDKFDRGVVVSVKDINLTDTQQTAAHSITAGL